MTGSADPRFDRVIAALNTLEAAQRGHAEVLERMQAQLAAAHRDAAAAREAAAFAKAETAAYQAEMAKMARRGDLERFAERLDATNDAVSDLHRNGSQAMSVRDQVVKLSRALSRAATAADLAEVGKRIEQIDDRLQVRMDHLADDVAATHEAGTALEASVAKVAGRTGDLGQSLEQRIEEVDGQQAQLSQRFDRVVATAEAEIERVAGHLEQRIIELTERVDLQSAVLAGIGDPVPAIDGLKAEVADLNRSLRVVRSTLESDRNVVRELDDRIFGSDGIEPRLMQLAQLVVEHTEREPESPSTANSVLFLEFQGRVEELVTKVEGLSTLRSRVELMEHRLDR